MAPLLLLLTLVTSSAEAQENAPGVVRGVVYDSTAAAPLVGATVTVVGTTMMAGSDADGSFRIGAVPPGTHRVTFFHPRLDELGLGPASWEADVGPGGVAEVALWIPSAETLARALCGTGPGLLLGLLREEAGGTAVGGGTVVVRWEEGGRERVGSTATGPDGRFALCGFPSERPLRVQGTARGRRGIVRELRIPPEGVLVQDVTLDLGAAARVTGRVVVAPGGEPVEGAVVRIGGRARVEITGPAGVFDLDGIPPGRRVLEVVHVAFGVQRDSLDLTPGEVRDLDVRISEAAVELEGVEVTARRPYGGHMAGFEERMERGRGEFLVRDQIAQRENQPLARIIVSHTPVIRLVCPTHPGRNPTGSMGRCWIESRRAMPSFVPATSAGPQGGGGCPMEYFVDGVYLGGDFDITLLDPHNVEALEIYPGPSTIPPRFKTRNANCGVVVIWMRVYGEGSS